MIAPGESDPAIRATPAEPLAVDAAEAARLLGISLRHLRGLDASGRLPRPIRLGRAVRWSVAELREWLAAACPARDRWEDRER